MQVEEQHVNICMVSQCSNTGAKTQTVLIIMTPTRMHIVVTSTGLDEDGERVYL